MFVTEPSDEGRFCPECGGTSCAEIFYGLPLMTEALKEAIKSKKLVLGGCCVDDDSPKWSCNDCGHKWGKIDIDALWEQT